MISDSKEALLERLREAEDTLEAIRRGEVDAVVVHAEGEQRVYTLESADRPYRTLVEHMQEGAVTLTGDGTMLYCNHRFAELVGFPRERLIAGALEPFVAPAERAVLAGLLDAGQRAGRAAELSLHRADGVTVPVTLSAVDLPTEPGMARIICVIATDLTHSRQRSHDLAAANALLAAESDQRRAAEERLAVALEAAGMGSWEMELASGLVFRSSRCDVILGLAPNPAGSDTLGDFLEAFVAEERDAVRTAIAHAALDGVLEFERRVQGPAENGSARWVHLKGRLYEREGQAPRLVGVVAEVTERRVMEQQIRQAQKMDAVGQLTGGIAHDFNNLLMVIGGSLEVLEGRLPDDAKSQRFLGAAKKGVERGAVLNQQLLAFARRQDLQAEVVCVDDLVRGFATLLGRAIGERIILALPAPADRWCCRTDPHQLETAILNLAINARDAMPEGGQLTISTDMQSLGEREAQLLGVLAGRYVIIHVQDTGTGIGPDVAARIFDPFYTTKGVGKGTGLGLSQVYGFARQSDGFASVESTLGKGTRMTIGLPLSEDSPNAAELPTNDAPQGDGLVLVVDDDDQVREVVVAMLTGLGYRTTEAVNAETALAAMAQLSEIRLVFSDVVMPGPIGGFELARRIRAGWPGVGIVLTSGYTAQQFDAEVAREAWPVLRKPYSRGDLAAAMVSAQALPHPNYTSSQ